MFWGSSTVRKLLRRTALTGALLLVSNPAFAAEQTDDTSSPVVEIPVATDITAPVSRKPPRYPSAAARRGIEGWVLVEFFVEVDGSVDEVVVLDSDPPGVFEDATIRAVKRWRYEAATVDGVPIRKATQVVLTYDLEGGGYASEKYRKISRRAIQAIDRGDLDEAYQLLQQLESLLYEGDGDRAHLDYQTARYYIARKDYFKAVHHLRHAMHSPGPAMAKSFQLQALTTLFRAEVILNHFSLSAETFELMEERRLLSTKDPIHKTYAKVRTILDGTEPLVSKSMLYGNRCYRCDKNDVRWRYPLSRNNFQIQDVNGSIKSLEISCGYQRTSVDFDPELSWAISDKWGECELQAIGKAGTEFRLAEFD